MSGVYFASHQAIQPFSLDRPETVADAVAASVDGPSSAYLAGGVDLIPALRGGQRPEKLIWLKNIPGIAEIDREGDTLRIGASATYRQIETDPVIRELLPDLSKVWAEVANIRVRLTGTFGGNIMVGNPAYDALPAAIALGARLRFATGDGMVETSAIEPPPAHALLLDLEIPITGKVRFAMDRSLKPAISVALGVTESRDGWAARAAVGCAYSQAWGADVGHAAGLAELINSANDLAAQFAAGMPEPLSDHNASGAYRRRMTSVLLARQLKALAA